MTPLKLTLRAACLALGLTATAMTYPARAQSVRPNIVLIVVDDAAFMDFGVYGGEARTPTIDRLAREGASQPLGQRVERARLGRVACKVVAQHARDLFHERVVALHRPPQLGQLEPLREQALREDFLRCEHAFTDTPSKGLLLDAVDPLDGAGRL